ncbi:MAG: ATP-grasp domain-containing protein [Acidobacteria bacterium]|nr:ATP-grasp domain-containing protein [Acidobacteriota bacterium]
MRVLVLATTTGYQTRAFGDAAEQLGVELVFATDRCHLIEDPWQDGAIAIRFYDEEASVSAIVAAAAARSIDGIVVVGDRPAVIAARVAQALGIPWHPPAAAAIATNKLRTRECLRAAGLPVPFFLPTSLSSQPSAMSNGFPCVVKPVALSGSRGVMRANDERELSAAIERLRTLMQSPEVRAERNEAHDTALVEGFIPGREYAVEALMREGTLQVLAIFDKPDPLDGPFFEETIYVTPSSASDGEQSAIQEAIAGAAAAIGLRHGPIHAECRVNADGVFVLEVAPRPIGGLCARALRFASAAGLKPQSSSLEPRASAIPFEQLLLRHALGEDVRQWRRESAASGVMMIPIARRGIYRRVEGVDAARAVPSVDDVRITAKADQLLIPLPEGASYLGFIFARAGNAADVERALRTAHARLQFTIAPEFPVLSGASINYNQPHG